MAKNVLLNTKPLAGTVTVMENGIPAEYVIAHKSYEADANKGLAAGYTFLVRKNVLDDRVAWASNVSATTDLEWTGSHCNLSKWLADTFYPRLEEGVRGLIAEAAFRTRMGASYGRDTASGKVFILASDDYTARTTGRTALDKTVLDALVKAPGSGKEWTRDVGNSQMEEPGMVNYYFTRVLMAYHESPDGWQIEQSGYPNAEYSSEAYVRPCFVVRADARITPDGTLCANHAPVIRSFYVSGGNLGAKAKPFTLEYSLCDADADTLTVTTTLGGTKVSSYTWEASGLIDPFAYTIPQNAWDALEWDREYELKITVTDGQDTTEWTQRFLKTEKRGYRVYAGTLTTNARGSLGFPAKLEPGSYRLENLQCIYDPTADDETRLLLDPEVNLQKNDFGTFELTMPKANVYYDKVNARKTVLLVEEDGAELFTGYVGEISKNFKMEKELYCDGEMGFLQDISMRLEAREWTAADLFTAAVNATTNAGEKSFCLGTISEAFQNEKVSTKDSGTQYTTVWSVLNDTLLQKTGGIIRLRKEHAYMKNNGTIYTRYLDFLTDITETTDQTIRYGENLLDLQYTIKAQDLVNRVKVYGYETKGFWFWKETNLITVLVENAESVAKYGAVERCILVEGTASTVESLKKAGEKYMNENGTPNPTGSFVINALDLKDAGVDVGRLQFLKRTRVDSAPHGISDDPLCTALRIPLDEPDNKEFTFGETVQSFTQKQASTSAVAKRSAQTLDSVIKYVSSTG